MRQLYRSISVYLLMAALSVGAAVAQKDTTRLNQSVEVMKAYHPSIANANKVNLMPVIEDTTRFSPEFKYSIDNNPVKNGFTASPMTASDVNKASLKYLGAGYLKLGAGTYSTPYGELFLNLPESKTAVFGLHIRHISSEGKTKLREGDLVDAPYSRNNAALFGGITIGNTILSTDLSYTRDAMNYYGYPTAMPSNLASLSILKYGLKQAYQKGDMKIALKSAGNSERDLLFNSGFRLGYFDSKTGQKESSAGLFGKFDYAFGTVNGILDFSYDHFATDSVSINNQMVVGSTRADWLRFSPSVRLDGDNWSFRGGINFVMVSDKDGEKVSKLYPDFEFNFIPVEGILTLYAGFKGDLKNNSYGVIASENYWTDPRHSVLNTDYAYVASGGLKGKISREISYNLGVKYSQVKDLYFYILNSYPDNSSSKVPTPVIYSNAFDVLYDNAAITNFSAEFSYISGKEFSVVLKGNYFNYSLDNLPFASQMPDFDLTTTLETRVIGNLTGFADLGITGKRQTLVNLFDSYPSTLTANTTQRFLIDPSIRLNLGATYELTSKFSLFGRVDNLLNRQNEQWLGYGSQGLRLMAGVTLSF